MSELVTKLDLLKDLDPLTNHIIASQRGKAGEIGKNRRDLNELVQRFVGSGLKPQVLIVSPQPLAVGAILGQQFIGRDFVPAGWKKALYATGLIGAVPDTDITWEAVLPGTAGNQIEIEYFQGAGALAVAFVAINRIRVTLAAGGSSPAAILPILAATPDCKYAVTATPGGAGLGNIALAPGASMVMTLGGGTGTSLLTANLITRFPNPLANLLFISRVPGPKGRTISVQYLHTGAPTPVVRTAGAQIVVEIDTGVTTANQVRAACLASEAVKQLVDVELAPLSDGTAAVAALAATHLDDMSGYWHTDCIPLFGGIPGNIVSVTNDLIVADFPLPAPFLAGDTVFFEVKVCDTRHTIPTTVV